MVPTSNQPDSRLWQIALAARDGDPHSELRDSLRASLAQVRRDSEHFAVRIAEDLPEFTVHDQTHLDALWPLADLVAPDDLVLTPPEVWILGVAMVLHDLGLAVAAYPGGREQIRQSSGWRDARAAALRSRLGRAPSADDLKTDDPTLDAAADAVVLRQRHADRAAELVDAEWDGVRLVADPDLRHALGPTAGRIASSHWWPVERLADLGALEGAPAGMSGDWTVRPILLAALLRIADAAHLDALRAPRVERVLRDLGPAAQRHWDFQERLRQPVLAGERLRYVSAQSFPVDLAGAWWLCLDHLRVLDDELAGSDALLQAHDLPRLAARSVQGARDPRELARLVKPDGWEPVDAQVGVSDLSRMIRRLGGRALYGNAPAVPLRELIQNSADAVRARQALQAGFRGSIEVHVSSDLKSVSVTDDGVGMGVEVLTGALLDFGRSLWESDELAVVLPGLQAAGFQPIGRFGIGFFSVFMWADEVHVISRPKHLGESETRVLSFLEGLSGRPVLRIAPPEERLPEPGTIVRLRLREGDTELRELVDPTLEEEYELLSYEEEEAPGDPEARLISLLRWLAPALDVDLNATVGDGPAERVVEAADWLVVPGEELLRRTSRLGTLLTATDRPETRVERVGGNSPVGRGALVDHRTFWVGGDPGVLVAGGLRVGATRALAGVLVADEVDASRGHGVPVVNPAQLAAWATAQAQRVDQRRLSDGRGLAETALEFGGDPGPLHLAKSSDGLLNRTELIDWARARDRVVVIDLEEQLNNARDYQWIPLSPTARLGADVIDVAARWSNTERSLGLKGLKGRSLRSEVEAAIQEAWELGPDELLVADAEGEDLVEVLEAESIWVVGEEWKRPQP